MAPRCDTEGKKRALFNKRFLTGVSGEEGYEESNRKFSFKHFMKRGPKD